MSRAEPSEAKPSHGADLVGYDTKPGEACQSRQKTEDRGHTHTQSLALVAKKGAKLKSACLNGQPKRKVLGVARCCLSSLRFEAEIEI